MAARIRFKILVFLAARIHSEVALVLMDSCGHILPPCCCHFDFEK